jgi:hypothetical protein
LPIEEDRFFELRFAKNARRDPIAAFDHFTGGEGVERFIGVDERKATNSPPKE